MQTVGTIFMLHRVHKLEQNRLFPNENMKVTPDFLENFIVKKQSQGYEFISLDKMYVLLKQQQNSNKKIVLTLDDGYKDNYTYAYPIFKKYNIPFTIYITTSFPNKNALLWWYVLEDLIINNKKIILNNNLKFQAETINEKNSTFLDIRKIIMRLNQKKLLAELETLFIDYKLDWFKYSSSLTLDWDNIIEMSNHKLCTIGGHTVNHFVFSKLGLKTIYDEINNANREIELYTGRLIEHFSYPFGDRTSVSSREFKLVNEFNFKTSTTTRTGNIEYRHKDKLNVLPRIMLTNEMFR